MTGGSGPQRHRFAQPHHVSQTARPFVSGDAHAGLLLSYIEVDGLTAAGRGQLLDGGHGLLRQFPHGPGHARPAQQRGPRHGTAVAALPQQSALLQRSHEAHDGRLGQTRAVDEVAHGAAVPLVALLRGGVEVEQFHGTQDAAHARLFRFRHGPSKHA